MVAVLCLIAPGLSPSLEDLCRLPLLEIANRSNVIIAVIFAVSGADGRNIIEESVIYASSARLNSLLLIQIQIPILVILP